jgi:hypothetical protein
MEYGEVKATIHHTASLRGENNVFEAVAFLESPIKTNYGRAIFLKGELYGKARIQTDNLRLMERMIYPLKYLIHH